MATPPQQPSASSPGPDRTQAGSRTPLPGKSVNQVVIPGVAAQPRSTSSSRAMAAVTVPGTSPSGSRLPQQQQAPSGSKLLPAMGSHSGRQSSGSGMHPAVKSSSKILPAVGSGSGVQPAVKSSSKVMPAVGSGSGVQSAVKGSSARLSAVGKPARDLSADRQALGLTALKPSELIAGLDQAAARAEQQEARQEQRRRAGGKLNANTAVHSDDTGRRWAWKVRAGIAGAILCVVAASALMIWLANRKTLAPRVGNERTRRMLSDLKVLAVKMPRFEEDASVSPEAVKSRLLETIEAELKAVNQQIQDFEKAHRTASGGTLEARTKLIELQRLKDPWDQDFTFSIKEDLVEVSAPGKIDSSGESKPPAPITFAFRTVKKK